MRNYASATPTQMTLTGLQLADWLETCMREVITFLTTQSSKSKSW
jgi:hypothetical protein